MPIEKRPTGEAAAVAQAGREIGQAEKAKREQQISLEQQAQDAARAWEIQKFILNSQQDFAHEQRMRQADLDVEARAKEWEREKMELASQLDFEQDERERLRKKATAIAGRDVILDSDAPETEKAQALFNLWQKFPEVTELTQYAGFDVVAARQAAKPQTIAQHRRELEAIVGLSEYTRGMSMSELKDEVRARGIDPDTLQPPQPLSYPGREDILGMGTGMDIAPYESYEPTGSLKESVFAKAEKRIRVMSPDGTTGTISAGEVGLPEYADFTIIDEIPPVEEPMFPSGAGATGGLTPEPKFPFRKVGSIKDLYNFLRGR